MNEMEIDQTNKNFDSMNKLTQQQMIEKTQLARKQGGVNRRSMGVNMENHFFKKVRSDINMMHNYGGGSNDNTNPLDLKKKNTMQRPKFHIQQNQNIHHYKTNSQRNIFGSMADIQGGKEDITEHYRMGEDKFVNRHMHTSQNDSERANYRFQHNDLDQIHGKPIDANLNLPEPNQNNDQSNIFNKTSKIASQRNRNDKLWSLMDEYIGHDKKSIQKQIVSHIEYTLAKSRFDFNI